MNPKALSLLLVLALAVLTGCGAKALDAPSPDGKRVAEVYSRWSIDPPAHSLWLRFSRESKPVKLANLAQDAEWCKEIIWSGDSSRVGFLIGGYRLDVYDARNGRLLEKIVMVKPGGSGEARAVSFLKDGTGVQFRECLRGGNRCAKVTLWKTTRRAGEPGSPASAA